MRSGFCRDQHPQGPSYGKLQMGVAFNPYILNGFTFVIIDSLIMIIFPQCVLNVRRNFLPIWWNYASTHHYYVKKEDTCR